LTAQLASGGLKDRSCRIVQGDGPAVPPAGGTFPGRVELSDLDRCRGLRSRGRRDHRDLLLLGQSEAQQQPTAR
jgi:hypothetical protein